MFWALKWTFLSLSGENKDFASVKNIKAGEGDWICVKEVLVWAIEI